MLIMTALHRSSSRRFKAVGMRMGKPKWNVRTYETQAVWKSNARFTRLNPLSRILAYTTDTDAHSIQCGTCTKNGALSLDQSGHCFQQVDGTSRVISKAVEISSRVWKATWNGWTFGNASSLKIKGTSHLINPGMVSLYRYLRHCWDKCLELNMARNSVFHFRTVSALSDIIMFRN